MFKQIEIYARVWAKCPHLGDIIIDDCYNEDEVAGWVGDNDYEIVKIEYGVDKL